MMTALRAPHRLPTCFKAPCNVLSLTSDMVRESAFPSVMVLAAEIFYLTESQNAMKQKSQKTGVISSVCEFNYISDCLLTFCQVFQCFNNGKTKFTKVTYRNLFELRIQPPVIVSSVWQYFHYLGQEVKNTKHI